MILPTAFFTTPRIGRLLVVLVVVAVLALLGVVGQMDYEDELAQEANYCKNVRDGVWPDYDNIYEEVCKKYELVVDSEAPSN